MWLAIFGASGLQTINGFAKEFYFSYALWAAFFSRISANWMYEFRMTNEVESGSVNSILVRPITFYEYYFSQFMGYKLLATGLSFVFPIILFQFLSMPTHMDRLPLALLLTFYYLIFTYTLSFIVAGLAFKLTRTHSLTTAKNFIIWVLGGELFPLDLIPQPFGQYVLNLPFSSGVYIPVGYLTGRLGIEAVFSGFQNVTYGIVVAGIVGLYVWRSGSRAYGGTGA